MENICPSDRCTGCSACYNICSQGAIRMEEDALGFLYPRIDGNLCVDCGMCTKVCPVNHPIPRMEPLHAFAAISKDLDDLMSSTSGGASSVLVNSILEREGVVYGCVQHSYREIVHQRVTTHEAAFALKGSKYVQSQIGTTFREVKADLQSGKEVLYTGTPCQIAGLKSFLRKDYPNLYLVDLVCHGVPSAKFLKEDIDLLFRKYNIQVKRENVLAYFRKKGTQKNHLKFGIFLMEKELMLNKVNKLFSIEHPDDNYMAGFMTGILFRENCFACPYANRKRVGDITLADFWGLGAAGKSQVSSKRGVSLLLLNTDKGKKLFELNRERFYYEERTVDEAVKGNGQLMHPFPKPAGVEHFRELYKKTNDFSVISSFLVEYQKNMRLRRLLSPFPFVMRVYNKIKRIV